MRRVLTQLRDSIWGTSDGWAVVRARGITRFMFRGAVGFAVWMAVVVSAINAVRHAGAFSPPAAVGLVVGRLLFDFVLQFALGLGVARMMWYQFDRAWVNAEVRRSVATRAAT
jgi:hypothetical protein